MANQPKDKQGDPVPLPYAPTGVAADANDIWVTLRRH